MKRVSRRALTALLMIVVVSLTASTSLAADFKREVIYQIITDRFFDGNAANNNPAQSSGLYDPSRSNWRAYWGGDLQGIQAKMSYLAGMGVTAIWISPHVDNLNINIPDGNGNPTASYHGYQGRDFKRVEEHSGDSTNGWTAFDNLVTAAHANGIKVIVDFAPNHSTQDNAGEFGALYDNGTFLGNYTADSNGYFHHNGNIMDWNDRYQVQYYTLFNLADINQEHATMDAYMKAAAQLYQQHGADGFRIDAVKHITWGWQHSLANSIYTFGDSFLFGEWFQSNTSDPLFSDSYRYANKSGISLLDFPLNTAIRNVFGSANANFSDLDTALNQVNAKFTWKEDLVTFIDNHDMARFLSINNNNDRLHQALAFTLTCRGIPCIYYGTEQYLHDDTDGGGDPYNRPQMVNFSTATTAYNLTKKLSDLRKSNTALGYGSMAQRWMNNDVYIYERKFYNSVVLVAINKSASTSYPISGLFTSLPAGSYSNYLAGVLSGPSITVGSGSGGNNPVTNFSLPANSVAVWQFTEGSGTTPQIGSVGPTVGQPGVKVTVAGRNFGSTAGTVKFGTTTASVVSWTNTKIVATVPAVTNGIQNITVTRGAQVSNAYQFTALQAKLIPVTFTVNNATPTVMGDYIFLTGNTVELGNWNTTWDGAIGPMNAPNYPNWFLNVSVPAGKTIQFKFIKIAANGAVTWEAGSNHSYTVPTSGTGFVNVNWQY
ncbi:MAG TPA: alpha-amylase family glycosyl hydrolase [Blastocatellia bacterium]|nr:alpha-amylase family glycosyl hydrolase [Blastocatellia bacterium]